METLSKLLKFLALFFFGAPSSTGDKRRKAMARASTRDTSQQLDLPYFSSIEKRNETRTRPPACRLLLFFP